MFMSNTLRNSEVRSRNLEIRGQRPEARGHMLDNKETLKLISATGEDALIWFASAVLSARLAGRRVLMRKKDYLIFII